MKVAMPWFARWFSWRYRGEAGATAVEYGLIIALIAVTVIGAVSALGTSVFDAFDDVAGAVDRCARFAEKDVAEPAADNVGGWKCQ